MYQHLKKGSLQEDIGIALFAESRGGVSMRNHGKSECFNPLYHGKSIESARQSIIVGLDSLSEPGSETVDDEGGNSGDDGDDGDDDDGSGQTLGASKGPQPDYISLDEHPGDEQHVFPQMQRQQSPGIRNKRRRAADTIRSSEERSVEPDPSPEQQQHDAGFIVEDDAMTPEEEALASKHLKGWAEHNGLRFTDDRSGYVGG